MTDIDLPEEGLIELAQARDPRAWTVIYDRNYPPIYRYAYARLGNREEAEDIASQVFVEALRSIGKFRYMGRPLLAWLYRIARNLVIERHRRAQRQPQSPLKDGLSVQTQDHTDNLELMDAISRLTKDQQEVIILRFLVALSAKEVAAVMGKKEPAVFSLQVRAINSLRRMLSQDIVDGVANRESVAS